MKPLILCLTAFLGVQGLHAQTNKAFVDQMVKHWQTSKELTLAVANAMPDNTYSFKASDAEMTFGGQMIHIALADGNYCSAALDGKNPLTKPADETKATALKALNTAFDYCIDGLQKMTDADLLVMVPRGAHPMSKFELMLGGFTHTAHHRGQAEVYLRLKGVTPPAYKF